MTARRVRQAGLRAVEAALLKSADLISAPTLATLKAKKTRELGVSPTNVAPMTKVVSLPIT